MRANSALLVLSVSLVLLMGLARMESPAGEGPAPGPAEPTAGAGARSASAAYVPGEIIIEMGPGAAPQVRSRVGLDSRVNQGLTGIASLDDLGRRFRVRDMKRLLHAEQKSPYPGGRSPVADFYVVSLADKGATLDALAAYRKDPSVATAQLNYVYTSDTIPPNDPLYSQQYAHTLTSAAAGWQIETGSSAVIIAVIGNGVQITHPDLAGKIVAPKDFIDGDLNPDPGSDGHDTRVSSIAAASTDNGIGIAGVCWGCRLMPIRAFFTTDQIATAIDYAVANGAKVVNMSFGNYAINKYGPDTAVGIEIDQGTAAGVVMVATAGNDGTGARRYPGALDNVIDVASTDSADHRSTFSNFGNWVDVAAPGTQIIAATVGGGYDTQDGTSLSAPYVSGLAGLLLSKEPLLTPADVRRRIVDTVQKVSVDRFIGSGRVNVEKALQGLPALFALIKSPVEKDRVALGPIVIQGTAYGDGYVLEYKPRSAVDWIVVASGPQTIDSALGTLDASGLDPGWYDLRLTSTQASQQDTNQVGIYLDHYLTGWPTAASGDPTSPVHADLDGDGKQETVVVTWWGSIWVFTPSGTPYPGWPVETGWPGCRFPPAIGDITGDGLPDIVLTSANTGNAGAWDRNGAPLPYWPKQVGPFPSGNAGSPVLVNLDFDVALEVVTLSDRGQVNAWNGNGVPGINDFLPGWPRNVGLFGVGTPAVGDLDGDGQMEIVVRQNYNSLAVVHAFNVDGTTVQGSWPVTLALRGDSQMALGDIDGNRTVDVVVTENTGQPGGAGGYGFLTALSGSGAQLFRAQTPFPFSDYLALADLDSNGTLEILFGDDQGHLNVMNSMGQVLPGWPVLSGGRSPTVANVDVDGAKEIISRYGSSVMAWNADGTQALAPIDFGTASQFGYTGTPAVPLDLEGDGDVELIGTNSTGEVIAVNLPATWSQQAADWPMVHADARNTQHYRFAESYADNDGDLDPNIFDCAPLDPAIHRGATEVCNGIDDNCDGLIDNLATGTCDPDIRVTPTSYGFGAYSVGESSAAQTFTVTNVGQAQLLNVGAVSLTGVNPYDFVVTANGCTGQSLPTGGNCTVQVAFAPKSTGARSGILSISSNDPDTPLLGVPLSGSAQTVIYNVIELPNADAGPNQGNPAPSGPHYLNVDDDPHDGDATVLTFSSGGNKEVFSVADALHDTDVISGVKVRWVAKKGSGSWTARAGLVFGGQEYYGPTVSLPTDYTLREEAFTNNPSNGQPWTLQDVRATKLIYQQVTITTQLPRASLTEIVLVVSVRRTPFGASLTELPNADVGPNQGSPSPAGPHYLNVDDDPHDGDATILRFATIGAKEVFSTADQLLDTDLVTSVKVRWVAKKGAGDEWTARAGLIVGGTEYYGPTVELPTNYDVREETFIENPATGVPWTVQEVRATNLVFQLVTIQFALPRPALTELVLVVSVQRMPVLVTLTELPNSDASPNQGNPTPAGAHYLNVDDDPHDGDGTILSFSSGGYKEVFTTADQLQDSDHVQNVKVRWVAKKGSGNNWNAKAGLVVSTQEYYGPTVTLTTSYTVREETFANNPATGQPWTVQEVRAAKLIYQQVKVSNQLPRGALTEIVLVVTVERAP